MWWKRSGSRVSGIRSVVVLVCGSHRCMLVLLFALLVVAVVFLFHDKVSRGFLTEHMKVKFLSMIHILLKYLDS